MADRTWRDESAGAVGRPVVTGCGRTLAATRFRVQTPPRAIERVVLRVATGEHDATWVSLTAEEALLLAGVLTAHAQAIVAAE